MKKLKHKKAFTIVELVIVIAVIAILSAILIPTFSDLIKKARESSDKQLVRNLNVAMAISEETDFSNMNNTLGLIFEESKINVSSIKASSGEILFDSKTNRFLLLNTSGDVIFWDTTKAKPNVNEKSYLYWKICDSSSLLDQKYSIYWNSEQQFPLNEIYVGFDCGANTLPVNLTYKNLTTEAKEITIRTNGGNLTIDGYADELGNGDEIHHYGFSDSVNIIKVANSSYHEYGKSIETTISFGHFVAEKDSYTALLNVENTVAVSPTINSSATVVVASNKSVNLIENKSNSEIYYATENQQTVNECEHNYIEIEDSNYKICTICGNILDTTHEHNYLDEYIVTETHHSKTCTICGHADSHEHHSVKINGTQATCTETGLTDGYYCDICEYIITEQQVISALGHSASDWIVTLEPTCTAKGSRHKICTVCNVELENEEINALGHDYNSVVTNPTCTEQGFTTHTCSRCGDSHIDTYVADLGHSYPDEYTKTETHHSKTCTICGHTDSHEHHSVKIDGTPATCTETGLADGYYCDICEYIITEQQVIPALGHSASDWIVTLEPTCTAKGSRHKICTVCNVELETEEINALGHDYSSVVTNPTCTEQGFTTHTCSRCGDSYIDTYVDANGHSYPDEYTKTETHHSKTCTICGHTDSHEHHSVKIDGTPATSTETGLTDGFYCDICGYVITEQEEIPVLEDVVTALYNLLNTANTSEESDIIIEIDKDYDLNNEAWTPINLTDTTKTITINGNNKTISNINASGTFAGLFGEVSCTLTINNLTINGGEINANVDNGSAGTFVGKHTSGTLTLSYCNVNNITVYGKKFAGGVIGTAAKATISHCTINNMNIRINKNSSNGGAGGVVGQTTTDKKVTIDRLSGSSNNLSGVNLGRFVGNNKGTCQVTNSSGFVTDPNTNTKGTGNTIT